MTGAAAWDVIIAGLLVSAAAWGLWWGISRLKDWLDDRDEDEPLT